MGDTFELCCLWTEISWRFLLAVIYLLFIGPVREHLLGEEATEYPYSSVERRIGVHIYSRHC